MKRTKEYFKKALEQQIGKVGQTESGNTVYGGNVLPILKLYENLDAYEEKMSFQEALTDLLIDTDQNKRRFAVTICIGFIDFRKVV